MSSPREGTPRGVRGRRLALWIGLAIGYILPSVGCQVEYAGMTLPSGKYMYDDVQYFPPGPSFPWANTHAATQRARMQAMGMDPGPAEPAVGPVGPPPPAAGALEPTQNIPNRPTNVNVLEPEAPLPGEGVMPAAPGAVPPGEMVPPPGAFP